MQLPGGARGGPTPRPPAPAGAPAAASPGPDRAGGGFLLSRLGFLLTTSRRRRAAGPACPPARNSAHRLPRPPLEGGCLAARATAIKSVPPFSGRDGAHLARKGGGQTLLQLPRRRSPEAIPEASQRGPTPRPPAHAGAPAAASPGPDRAGGGFLLSRLGFLLTTSRRRRAAGPACPPARNSAHRLPRPPLEGGASPPEQLQ